MYNIDNSTAATVIPTPGAPGPNLNGFFTVGNPAGQVPATTVDADWLNAVQGELSNAVTGSGQALSKTNRSQLLQTVQFFGGAYAVDTGTVNALVITLAPAITALSQIVGMPLRVKVLNTITGAATININGLGAVSITNPNANALVPNQMIGAGSYTMMYDGTAVRLQSISSSGIPPVVSLSGASALTLAQTGALVELTGASTFTTTLPTPVGNHGTNYQVDNASSAAQTFSTPAGLFNGPNGNGTASISIPAGASIYLQSDGTNYLATDLMLAGGYAPAAGNAAQAFAVSTAAVNTNTTQAASTAFVLAQAATATPAANGTGAVGVSTLYARQDHVHPTYAPLSAAAQAVGNNTTTSASVSFTAPGPGILVAIGSRNLGGTTSQSNTCILYINGNQVATDDTGQSMTHMGVVATNGGSVSASYQAAAAVAFSANVILIYIPNI